MDFFYTYFSGIDFYAVLSANYSILTAQYSLIFKNMFKFISQTSV